MVSYSYWTRSHGWWLCGLFPAKRIAAQEALQTAAKGDIDDFFKKLESGEFDQKIDPSLLKAFSMTRRETDLTPQLSAFCY